MSDILCSVCREPWDAHHLRHDVKWEVSQLESGSYANSLPVVVWEAVCAKTFGENWRELRDSQRDAILQKLSADRIGDLAAALRCFDWEFRNGNALDPIRCPCCPDNRMRLPQMDWWCDLAPLLTTTKRLPLAWERARQLPELTARLERRKLSLPASPLRYNLGASSVARSWLLELGFTHEADAYRKGSAMLLDLYASASHLVFLTLDGGWVVPMELAERGDSLDETLADGPDGERALVLHVVSQLGGRLAALVKDGEAATARRNYLLGGFSARAAVLALSGDDADGALADLEDLGIR